MPKAQESDPPCVYIGFGSNLGDRVDHCKRAVDEVRAQSGCRVNARSPLYRTEPVGVEGQDWFVNGVMALSTRRSPRDLLALLHAIEKGLGRERKEKWAPRTIDLDILIFGQYVSYDPELTVPHPLMHVRRFVLVPMVDIAPQLVHPVLGKSMVDLLRDLPEEGQAVLPLGET